MSKQVMQTQVDPDVPQWIVPYVQQLLEGESLDRVVAEAVVADWDTDHLMEVGYWVDLCRLEDVESGLEESIDELWRSTLRIALDEHVETLERNARDEEFADRQWRFRTR